MILTFFRVITGVVVVGSFFAPMPLVFFGACIAFVFLTGHIVFITIVSCIFFALYAPRGDMTYLIALFVAMLMVAYSRSKFTFA